jgi:hypothetical protein
LRDLWSDSYLKTNLICSCFVWLHGSFNFYMITFYLKYFPGNIFVNAMCFAGADLTAYTLSGVVLKFFNVRTGLTFSYIVSALGGIAYISYVSFIPNEEDRQKFMVPILVALCRVGGSMSFNIGYVSVARLFPTEYVTTVFGIVNLVSHSVAVLAPIMAEVPDPTPMYVFCANSVAAVFWAQALKETEVIKEIRGQVSGKLVENSLFDSKTMAKIANE